MSEPDSTLTPLLRIFHPSDFSPASELAFAHALKLALEAKADLEIMHVARHVVGVHLQRPGATFRRFERRSRAGEFCVKTRHGKRFSNPAWM